ncbi:MAG: lytic transglycosylase domain-containing protein [Acidobacteriota bacterium]
MRSKLYKYSTGLLTLAFLALPASGWTFAPEGWRPPAPDPTEVRALEDISSWFGDVAVDRIRGRYHVPPGVREAVRENSASVDFFLNYNDKAARDARLKTFPYGELIAETADSAGIDGLLLASVVEAESSFVSQAVSPVGAIGLAQVMPYTAEGYTVDELREPEVNLRLGANYLASLLKRYDGDLERSLAAYNAGPTAVRRFGGIPPYRETQRYVSKVLSIYFDHHQELWSATEEGALLQ